MKFIEGVGRNYTIFEWYDDIDKNYQSCKYDGDELVYSTNNPLFEDCKYDNASVGELSDENKVMKIYPNPASEMIHIEGIEAVEIQVYNALGQVVKTVLGTNEIDLSGLVEGVYLVRIMDADGENHVARVMVK